jgi:ubiquinone/menaquinone biosynthesis C-methylase UbiE
MGDNDQDEIQTAIANVAPVPGDTRVRRILDIGCGVGQTTVALKRRFPDAEVWGIDVGGPMVHYAHMRATDLGVDVNFRQGLAEASGFPDGHFDMVVSYILLHEVPNVKNTEIMKEVSRLLRSGGNYYPVDFFTARPAPKGAYRLFHHWWDHRWNNEVWAFEHMEYDLVSDLERFGMAVDRNGPGASLMGGPVTAPNLFATKRA